MELFCSPLWDQNLTWGPNNSWPQFTDCFQNTVLVWIACLWIWIVSPFYISLLIARENSSESNLSWKHTFKTLLLLAQILVCIMRLLSSAHVITSKGLSWLQAEFVGALVENLTLVLVLICTELVRKKAVISSGVLFVYWFLTAMCEIIPFYSKIMLKEYEGDLLGFVLFYINCALIITQVVLHSFADLNLLSEKEKLKDECPELKASFLSKITFWWMNSTIWSGYRKPFKDENDIFPLHPDLESDAVVPKFQKNWENELKRKQAKCDCKTSAKDKSFTSLRNETKSFDYCPHSNQMRVSLLKVLVKTFGWDLFLSHLMKIPGSVGGIINVLLVRCLINFADDPSSLTWKGYIIVATFFLLIFSQTMLRQQLHYKSTRIGYRVRSSLVAAVFEKSLTINNKVRTESTVGEIVNMMSVDIERIHGFMGWCLWCLWCSPTEAIVIMYILYDTVGPAMLSGLTILILIMPLNAFIMMKFHKLEDKMMKYKDERIKLLTEVINGIKILKLYAWELSFRDRIKAIRDMELNGMWKDYVYHSFMTFCWHISPFFVGLATLTTYVFMSEECKISPQVAFVSISLLEMLRGCMNVIPIIITEMIKVNISLKRLDKFLNSRDLKEDPKANADPKIMGNNSVYIEDGTFTWDVDMDSCLTDINLKIPQGSLVAVVGQVGSGKSSLLSAMLGEMEKISGKVAAKGRVAYVSQQAWIQNTTLRNNILFGKEMDKKKYDEVIQECALTDVLSVLSGGDMTEIGEKGINLSGGQKQRVSLARAVYFDSDIYLLDDPLSAIDSHVGKYIFDKVISDNGLLKEKTRVLVTHGVHWLPKVDFIVVMSGGTISEIGSYEELMEQDGVFAQFLGTYLNSSEGDDNLKVKTWERQTSIQSNDDNELLGQNDIQSIDLVLNSLRQRNLIKSESDATDCTIPEMRKSKLERQQNVQTWLSKSMSNGMLKKLFLEMSSEEKFKCSSSHQVDTISIGKIKLKHELSLEEAPVGPMCHEGDDTCGSMMELMTPKLKREFFVEEELKSNTLMETATNSEPKRETIIEEESLGTGMVKLSVIMAYGRAIGFKITLIILVVYTIYNVFTVYSTVWLSHWTLDPELQNLDLLAANSSERFHKNLYYAGMYGVLGAMQVILLFSHSFMFFKGRINASSRLHQGMLTNVLRCPMEFFDRTPIGRVINRFSMDIDSIDGEIPLTFYSCFQCLCACTGSVLVITYSNPTYMVFFLPLGMLFFCMQRLYVQSSRQLRRIQSNTRSLIYNQFSETISGASVIRAFGVQDAFIRQSKQRVDRNLKIQFAHFCVEKWIAMRVEIMGALVVVAAGIFAVLGKDYHNGAIVGLSISYALRLTGVFNLLVHVTCSVETSVVSVERVLEYTDKKTEALLVTDLQPPPSWPTEGNVEFKSYSTRYRDGLDLVVQDISVSIKPGDKVGLVGRSGAGKSSLTLALFRLIEPVRGQILVDNVDISKIGLHDLRARLTILPQEPVLFSGSLRMNLDPHDTHTNEAIWMALEQAHLKSFVESLPSRLYFECGEGGQNVSIGQRQLICLARSLLKKSKVLILDEATAAIDMETDDLIQKTIRAEFADCTVLTIAHRLNTVMDYDKKYQDFKILEYIITGILVLDKGMVKEFGSPLELLSDNSSTFYQMAKDSGMVGKEEQKIGNGARCLISGKLP